MLDIGWIRKEPEAVRQRLLTRGKSAADGLDKVLQVDEERRAVVGGGGKAEGGKECD